LTFECWALRLLEEVDYVLGKAGIEALEKV
jgi:hypothetical protein